MSTTRKKIVLQTNAPWMKTGLGENGRYLMKHLVGTGKYDIVYYCTNHVMSNEPQLSRLPCKAYGAIPHDQNVINQMNANPNYARDVAYGSHFIDQIIKDEKPDIWWESDDIWSTAGYLDKPWFKHINAVFHKTPDSRPILEEAFKQARATPYFTTWSEFAAKEMRKVEPALTNVRHVYGMFDTNHFSPISKKEKHDLRRRFGIDMDTVIFHTTNRNQLRKQFAVQIEAFAAFKRVNPHAKVKLHFHTSFSDKQSGWDIPKLAAFHGIKDTDILCTYVCRTCGNWHIAPYKGEDVDCQYCGTKDKRTNMITANVNCGVPDEEMRLMHGVCDAGVSCFSSGGLERFSIASLLCGLPTAISAYSCGEDFKNLPFVHPIEWAPYYEHQTSFMKATAKVGSLVAFMTKVWKMKEGERQEITTAGRDWAVNTFSCATIGKQWEDMFDAMPPKDWSTVSLETKPKNADYPMPTMTDNELWVRALYNHILLVEPDPDGLRNWLNSLAGGMSRDHIYQYFVGEARKDNAKNAKPVEFGELFDKTDRKRILYVIKESGGDIFVSTATYKGLKDLYPDADLYVACEPRFAEILAGNPYIHKVLPFHPMMEQELTMIAYVNYYYYPALPTQVRLAYLSKDRIGLDLEELAAAPAASTT